jgi:SAM-dependent methyltransferase
MGPEQIRERGHRNYVGAKWDVLGKLQLEFLVKNGLQPHHVLYDIACGSLRAGIHLIPYLNKGNYIGIDKEKLLIELGIDKELGQDMYQKKKPEFLVTDSFEFEKISKSPDYAIAQSLFTHLTLKDITKCLRKLRAIAKTGCKFYATFDEEQVTPKAKKRQGLPNPPSSHSNLTFYYSSNDIESCVKKANWSYQYIGDFGHPSKQQMVLFWI